MLPSYIKLVMSMDIGLLRIYRIEKESYGQKFMCTYRMRRFNIFQKYNVDMWREDD